MITFRRERSQITLFVDGIRCNHCESSIRLALSKVSGVKQVKVHKRKQVVIMFDAHDKISRDELVSAIKNAGYFIRETA